MIGICHSDDSNPSMATSKEVLGRQPAALDIVSGHVVPVLPGSRHDHYGSAISTSFPQVIQSARDRVDDDPADAELLELLDVSALSSSSRPDSPTTTRKPHLAAIA